MGTQPTNKLPSMASVLRAPNPNNPTKAEVDAMLASFQPSDFQISSTVLPPCPSTSALVGLLGLGALRTLAMEGSLLVGWVGRLRVGILVWAMLTVIGAGLGWKFTGSRRSGYSEGRMVVVSTGHSGEPCGKTVSSIGGESRPFFNSLCIPPSRWLWSVFPMLFLFAESLRA